MKEQAKNYFQAFGRTARILLKWLLLAVPTGLLCGIIGTAFHLAVEYVTELRGEHVWLLWMLPLPPRQSTCRLS